jgi:hypothetical protein
MYVAWTAGYVGAALVAGTAWPLVLLPAERPVAWLAGCRRLRIRYDRDPERFFASLGMSTRSGPTVMA